MLNFEGDIMKKETKRYLIVEYAGIKQRVYDTKEDLDKALDEMRKYNNRKTTKYICGNVDVQYSNGKYYVKFHVYNKLTEKNTISDIDNFTRNFNKGELAAYFILKSKMKNGYEPDINIAYFESKDATDEDSKPLLYGIKYIPVLYKEDMKYLDDTYIKKCLRYHAEEIDIGFFKEMASEFCFHHVVADEVEKLYLYCDKVAHQGYDRISLYRVSFDLYQKLIYEREKDGSLLRDDKGGYQISARRKRDFAFFLKNYNSKKKVSPLRYNGSITKMMIDDLKKQREALLEKENIKSLKIK
jgi:hypothetical protein